MLWKAQNCTKTFNDPDGAFSFHADSLIHCEQRKQGDDEGYYWSPENCSASHPVCDDLLGTQGPQTSIACFAYPRNSFTNTPAFEAATFSVEIVDHKATERSYLTADPDAT